MKQSLSWRWILPQAAALILIGALVLRLELGSWQPGDWGSLPFGDFRVSKLQQDFGDLRLDASVSGGPLRSGGRSFSRGLGVHAVSRVRLAFGREGARFTGLCGMDDNCAESGSIVCSIEAGAGLLFQSRVLRCGEPPQPFSVPVEHLHGVMLKVSDAGDGNTGDHADWLELKLE